MPPATSPNARPASPLSPPADGGYPLAGPSDLPDPATHAYRSDLADVALAGRVIASHYAEPLQRRLTDAATLRDAPSNDASPIAELPAGATIGVLDIRGGWAWGYGPSGEVGYVAEAAIG
ncbi:SH3 domain-containing protein [Sphingomonas mesophila]|uniref:SH3 domain-containing protein n=1 Tax=Sphingomonas mesophila TaxID=2303576 RepID=UPI001F086762|nr:SH3 domain-containing protein [Sphingomonas mesophila]